MTTATLKSQPLTDFVHVVHLPRLEIVTLKTASRSCYTECNYRVRSCAKLSRDDFDRFLELGYFLQGQGFHVYGIGDEQWAGRWSEDGGKSWVSFYEYEVSASVDSSD